MQSMIEDIYFIEKLNKKLRHELGLNKQLIYDTNTNNLHFLNPDFHKINSYSLRSENIEPSRIEKNERLIDIIEEDENVAVTIDMPGVEKNDINLGITEDSLKIAINSTLQKYHKLLKLPNNVNIETARATYRNGVLDVVINKKKKAKSKN